MGGLGLDARDQQDLLGGMPFFDFPCELEAVHAWHVFVRDHEVEGTGVKKGEGPRAVLRLHAFGDVFLKETRQNQQDERFVIHEQHPPDRDPSSARRCWLRRERVRHGLV